MAQPAQDVVWAGVKVTPPILAYGITLNEWVAIATIAYIALQAAFLVWKWWRAANGKATP